MHFFTFIGMNVMLSAMITIILHDMSRPPISEWIESPIIDSLTSYYKNRSIIQTAFYSGFTHFIIIFISMVISYFAFQFKYPKTALQLVYLYGVVFPVAFIVAYLSKYLDIIGDLEAYYEEINPGVAEGVRSLITVTASYGFMKFFLSFICKYFLMGSHG